MNFNDKELLNKGLEQLGFSCIEISDRIEKYIKEIELFNTAYSLVKVNNSRDFIIKHIFDSLTPLKEITYNLEKKYISAPWKIADVGSGAGLPGIPLSIVLSSSEFTLIERMKRRAGFLQNCKAVLGLKNVDIEEIEMELAAPGRFDLVVLRAFHPIEPLMLKNLLRLIKPNGFLGAWKGRYEIAKREISGLKNAMEIIPIKVPFLNEQRCLALCQNDMF